MKNLSLTLATKPKALVVLLIALIGGVLGLVISPSASFENKESAIPIGTGAVIGLLVGFALDGWIRSNAWNNGIPDAQKPSAVRLYLDLSAADGSADKAEFANLPEIQKVFIAKAKKLSSQEAMNDCKNHLNSKQKALLAHHFDLIIKADGVTDVSETEMRQKLKEGIGFC